MNALLHFVRYVCRLDAPATQVTERELALLLKYSKDAKVICELGCFEGKTSVAFAKNTTGTVYSVDPFFSGRLGISYAEWIAKSHRKRNRANNLVFLNGLSNTVAEEFRLPIDFLFIDADHSYEAIKADWENWTPKVVDAGLIALHDARSAQCSPGPLGSMRFFAEDVCRLSNVREVGCIDSLSIVEIRNQPRR